MVEADAPASTSASEQQLIIGPIISSTDLAAAYPFVEMAFGTDRPRCIVTAASVDCVNGREMYTTWMRFPQALKNLYEEQTNGNGNHTTRGYSGLEWASELAFDLDGDKDPLDPESGQLPLEDARKLVLNLRKKHVPPAAIRVFWSGRRGFHVHVLGVCFGEFTPAVDLHQTLGRLAQKLATDAGVTTLDPSLYQARHLLRVANSKHDKSDRFKIELTHEQLLTWSLDEIKNLASRPQLPEEPDISDVRPVNALIGELQRALKASKPPKAPRATKAQNVAASPGPSHLRLVTSDDVVIIPEGQRNAEITTLMASARTTGRGMNATELYAFALDIAETRCVPPYTSPAELVWLRDMVKRTCEKFPRPYLLTDLGNAYRILDRYGPELRFCRALGGWLVWTGTYWKVDSFGAVRRMAQDSTWKMFDEAKTLEDGARAALVRHATHSQSSQRLQGCVDVLEAAAKEFYVEPDQLDADAWALPCTNGTIDLKNGELRESRPEDLATRCLPIAYDPGATCPTFTTFLDSVMDGRPELVAYLRRVIGYCLTGSTRERAMFILHGSGANGKSTLIDIVSALLDGYATTAEASAFLSKKQTGGPSNDIAALAGSRFVSVSESEKDQALATALVKRVTGNDKITARFLHKEFFSFKPTFKLFLGLNHKPEINDAGAAIWSRIKLIPFDVKFAEADQDKTLPEKLRNELPGILAWAVAGCLEWQRLGGLQEPAEVTAATRDYREDQDVLGPFISSCCVLDPQASAPASALHAAYLAFIQGTLTSALSVTAFGVLLGDRPGLSRHKNGKGLAVWHGLRLLASNERL
jgi:putative DNA primase/helicase